MKDEFGRGLFVQNSFWTSALLSNFNYFDGCEMSLEKRLNSLLIRQQVLVYLWVSFVMVLNICSEIFQLILC